MSKRQDIINRALELPQMPAVIQQVMTIMQDENASMTDMGKAIELDPGLTVTLLSMANSSYFGGVRQVESVREAIVRLGAKRVFQMVMAVGVAPYAKKPVKGYGLESCDLLKHSIAVAVASELTARELNIQAPPHTFTSGLLVNIGKIVLGTFLEVDAQPIMNKAYEDLISFEQAEREVLGIDHAELGAMLLEHWKVPGSIVLVARYRLNPEEYPEQDMALDLVHVGDMIAKMTGVGGGVDGLHYTPSPVVLDRLGLDQSHVYAIMEELMAHVDELSELIMPNADSC